MIVHNQPVLTTKKEIRSMQPIHYALAVSLLTLLIGGALAWVLASPMLFVVCLILVFLLGRDTVGRFGGDPGPEDDPGGEPIGFVR